MQAYILIHSLIFVSAFPLGAVAWEAAPRGPEILHDQQQFQIVQLDPHQDRTKQGRRCSYATCCLDKLCAAFPWV